MDYVSLGVCPHDATKAEVLISSTAVDFAEARMELIESYGLNVIAQEPESLAMARALTLVGAQDARMIIDLGERSTDLVDDVSRAAEVGAVDSGRVCAIDFDGVVVAVGEAGPGAAVYFEVWFGAGQG